MSSRFVMSGPYAHEKASVRRSMGLVMLALTPATAFAFYLFAWPAIFLFVLIVAAALGFEAASLALAGKPVRMFLTDGSALLTGWLLAMSLPPSAPWWIGPVSYPHLALPTSLRGVAAGAEIRRHSAGPSLLGPVSYPIWSDGLSRSPGAGDHIAAVRLDTAPIPVPAGGALLLSGLGLAALVRRRKSA